MGAAWDSAIASSLPHALDDAGDGDVADRELVHVIHPSQVQQSRIEPSARAFRKPDGWLSLPGAAYAHEQKDDLARNK
jgi:hypothetical protein